MVDTGNQAFDIVILTGDMMSASHVKPVHFKKPLAEFFFHGAQRGFQIIRILFTEGMKMKTVHKISQFVCKIAGADAHTGAGRTGIVNRMAFLRGAFRVDAKSGFCGSGSLKYGEVRSELLF